jgi:CP family cyanate transporter-like MFS transporter
MATEALNTPRRSGSGAGVLVAIIAAAFNTRLSVAGVAPVIDDIRRDTAMSSALAGVLTTIPFLCMGVFAFAGPPLVLRLGTKRLMVVSLLLTTVGTLARSLAPTGSLVIAATVLIGLGIALIGVALPVVIKERFAHRAGVVTGAYVASMSIGIGAVGFAVVPLAAALGGWREALAVAALLALLAVPLWTGIADADGDVGALPVAADELADRFRWPARDAWLLGTIFGLHSACFAGMLSWAPAVYADAGWSEGEAAMTISAIGVYTIVGALTVPWLMCGREGYVWIAAFELLVGLSVIASGLLTTTAGWGWVTIFGLAAGALFPLLLALPLHLRDDPRAVAELAAWMFGLGYLITSVAPFAIGALRDMTGGFAVPMALLGCVGVASSVLAYLLPWLLRERPGP